MSAANSSPYVKAIGWGLLVGGLACVGIEVAMAWLQGDVTAATETGKVVNKASAITIAVVGVVIVGLAAGACRADKKFGWARGLTFVMVLSGIASINNMTSFQATERISASKSREAEIARAKAADALGKESASKTLTFAGRAKSTAAREDFMYGNQEAIKAFRDAKVEVRVEPDAGAQIWATISGWSLYAVQMFWSTYISILVTILGMVCFQGAGYFLNPLAWGRSETVSATTKGSGGSGGGGGGETLKTPDAPREKQPATVAAKQAQILPLRKAETPVASSPVQHPLTVSDYLRRNDGATFTSQAAIAKATGLSPATVSRQLQKLEGRGKVKRSKHKRGANAVTYGGRSAAPIYA